MTNVIRKILKCPQILKQFMEYPERNFTPLELSKICKIPYATARRYVLDLQKTGIVDIERVGAYNVCRLNAKSPLIFEVRKILKAEFSPHRLAAAEFSKKIRPIRQVRRAILFGSVATGGEKLSSDVDIAVILVHKSRSVEKKINSIAGKILEDSRMRIIPIFLTEKEGKAKNTQFAKELEKGVVIYERY